MSAERIFFNSGFRHITIGIFSYLDDPQDVQNCFKADSRFIEILRPTGDLSEEEFQSWVEKEAAKGNCTPFVLMLNMVVKSNKKLIINAIYKRAIERHNLNMVKFIREAYELKLITVSGTRLHHHSNEVVSWDKPISEEKWHFIMLGIFTACQNNSLEILKFLVAKRDYVDPSIYVFVNNNLFFINPFRLFIFQYAN